MTVWLLIIVLWNSPYPDPSVAAYATASRAECLRLLDSFGEGEDAMNEQIPNPTDQDHYSAMCEMKTGGERDKA